MHSCSDKRELVRSAYASTPACKKDRTDPRCCLASGKGKEGEERRWRRHVFNTRVLQGLWWSSQKRERREKESGSRASSSPGRKEEFPLASDCLTCKNAAFVAGLRSFFWQAVCDQLSPFPFSLFLCRFTCLPSNPVSLDSARLQAN